MRQVRPSLLSKYRTPEHLKFSHFTQGSHCSLVKNTFVSFSFKLVDSLCVGAWPRILHSAGSLWSRLASVSCISQTGLGCVCACVRVCVCLSSPLTMGTNSQGRESDWPNLGKYLLTVYTAETVDIFIQCCHRLYTYSISVTMLGINKISAPYTGPVI